MVEKTITSTDDEYNARFHAESPWVDRRTGTLSSGGYGSQVEQLEILGEQGIVAFQAHIADVKARVPKI